MSLLQFEQVSRSFSNGSGSARRVLEGVDLALDPGEIIALTGPSGAGKTTLLFLAGGLCQPTAGRVRFEGRDLAGCSSGELARLWRDRIALVFQNNFCLSALPVWENAVLPLLLRGLAAREARRQALELLERVELAALADASTQALSGGQRQRLSLARAMALRPRLLLADEPTADLDEATARRVEGRLFDWLEEAGSAALIVTHSAVIEGRIGRVLRLDQGRLTEAAVAADSASVFLSPPGSLV